jgi:putative endopeptidase
MTYTRIRALAPHVATALGIVLLASGLPAQTGRALGVDTTFFDRSVRPQDDFYRFVNGGWLRDTQIPADRSTFGTFVQLRDRSEQALHELLEEAAAGRHPAGSDLQKIGDFYATALDSARAEQLGVRPLQPTLARIAAVSSREQLPELFAELQKIGVQTPFSFFVGQDARQATRYVTYAGQSGLGLPDRDYYLKPDARFAETRTAYRGYVATLLRLAGVADADSAAARIVGLETALAEKHWDRARNRDREATYNPRTVAELNALTPGFGWDRYLAAVGAQSTPAIVVRQPDYLQGLGAMMQSVPLETWKAYETFKALDAYGAALDSRFTNARFAFRGRVLQGLQEQLPRWKRAVQSTEGALGEAAGRVYVDRNFRPEQKARMQALVTNLIAAFREGIDRLQWMGPETRAQAQSKLAQFNVKIGYPDRWRDYSALEVTRGDLVGNLMRSARFEHARNIKRLGEPVDRTEWGMTPQTVNAYYSSTMNEIVFPAAILQPPFFNPDADDAVNYGAIGAVIGHEISHGFDDQGRRSDGEGNLRDWWTETDNAAFQTRANALVEQYSAYSPLEGLNVNGRLTLGENIGDLSGLAVAYRAYHRSLQGREAPVIGGFTGDQRFFLGWAQIWRSKFRDEALRQQLLSDSHSPGEYRTNGVLRNMPEFYQAFGVRDGDRMYTPADRRVTIW